MPVLKGRELRIVGFLCNWCSYGGADTAGVARAGQPTDLRIIRVPCSGRVNPLFPLRALMNGADGVLVSGCHPRDCHYGEGNYHARRRLELLREFLPVTGIDPARFEYVWVSASEGHRWQQVVTAFTERIHRLGPAPRFGEVAARPDLVPGPPPEPARPLGGVVETVLAELRERLRAALAEGRMSCAVGWRQGFDALHAAPLIMRRPEDADCLILGPLNVHSAALHLPRLVAEAGGRKVGVVVRGCDGRGVVELIQEGLLDREAVEIFAVPCTGTIDAARLLKAAGSPLRPERLVVEGDRLILTADGREQVLSMRDAAQDKCRACTAPDSPLYDHFIGMPSVVPAGAEAEPAAVLRLLDSLTLEERMGFWKAHIGRCIRCYACRNACPMCVCREHCVAESRDPHWLTQEDTVEQKLFFQFIHALHLAGRCTGCAECARACPMNIPVGALKLHTGRIVRRLFDGYVPGTDATAVPPFLTFRTEEPAIPERRIEGV